MRANLRLARACRHLLLFACVCPPLFFMYLFTLVYVNTTLVYWLSTKCQSVDASVDFQLRAFLHTARTDRLYITSIDGRGRTVLYCRTT